MRKPTISARTLHSRKCEVMLVKGVYCTSGALWCPLCPNFCVNKPKKNNWPLELSGFALTCSAPVEMFPDLKCVCSQVLWLAYEAIMPLGAHGVTVHIWFVLPSVGFIASCSARSVPFSLPGSVWQHWASETQPGKSYKMGCV